MCASIIKCRLDLLVRLIDTTNGIEVEERNVRFFKDGHAVHPVPRGSGNHVFINSGRENFQLEVFAQGYEPSKIDIDYETLDSQMPLTEVFLIPSENTTKGQPVITLKGSLPGLQTIEAVNISSRYCAVGGFDERKRIMQLLKSNKASLDDRYYGLIHMRDKTFEPFIVEKVIANDSVKLSQPLKEQFSVNSPIARIIFGRVTPEGDYCIRVRDDSERLEYIIRYVTKDNEKFAVVDFHQLEGVSLE